MHNRLENVFGVISLISWITAIGATLTGKWLVPLVLGRAYASAWPVLAIHGWTALFFFSSQVRSNYLALRRAPIAQAVTSGLSLLVQMFFNFWLVSRYGLIGAATAFLLTQLFSAWVLPLIVPQLRPCLAPQARGLIAPWRPSKWREFISATSG
jgi:PST family polysaccharide transporter